jgi:hypothetical protein
VPFDTVTHMHIDCEKCIARDTEACDDCVVTFILHSGSSLDLESDEMEALELLAEEGLVPKLRLVVEEELETPHAEHPDRGRNRRRA